MRTKAGHCLECSAGEAGEMLGLIVKGDPSGHFEGYVGGRGKKGSNEKKVCERIA